MVIRTAPLSQIGLPTRVGLMVGGLLIGISPLLPWVDIYMMGEMNAFTATSFVHSGGVIPVILLLLGIGGIALGVMPSGAKTRLGAAGVAVLAGVLGGVTAGQLGSLPKGLFGLVTVGAGVWITVIGAVITLIAGLLPATQPDNPPSPPNYTAQ